MSYLIIFIPTVHWPSKKMSMMMKSFGQAKFFIYPIHLVFSHSATSNTIEKKSIKPSFLYIRFS